MSLAELRPLVEIMAAERTTSTPHLFDDAVQEGLIAAWKARKARPDAPNSYVVGAARNGVRSVVRGRPGTGQTGHRGVTDASTLTEHDAYIPEHGTPDTYSVELGEVWGAVKRLPPIDSSIATLRAYSYEWREVASIVGMGSEATRRRFVNHIAPRLAAELGHLREVA